MGEYAYFQVEDEIGNDYGPPWWVWCAEANKHYQVAWSIPSEGDVIDGAWSYVLGWETPTSGATLVTDYNDTWTMSLGYGTNVSGHYDIQSLGGYDANKTTSSTYADVTFTNGSGVSLSSVPDVTTIRVSAGVVSTLGGGTVGFQIVDGSSNVVGTQHIFYLNNANEHMPVSFTEYVPASEGNNGTYTLQWASLTYNRELHIYGGEDAVIMSWVNGGSSEESTENETWNGGSGASWESSAWKTLTSGLSYPATVAYPAIITAAGSLTATTADTVVQFQVVDQDNNPYTSVKTFAINSTSTHFSVSWDGVATGCIPTDTTLYIQWRSPNGDKFNVDSNDDWTLNITPINNGGC